MTQDGRPCSVYLALDLFSRFDLRAHLVAYRVPQSNYVLKLCEICMIGLFPNYGFVEKIRRGGGVGTVQNGRRESVKSQSGVIKSVL